MTVIWWVIKMSNRADKFSFSPPKKKKPTQKLYIKLFLGALQSACLFFKPLLPILQS